MPKCDAPADERAVGPVEFLAQAAEGESGLERTTGARTSHHVGKVIGLTSGGGDHAGPTKVIAPRAGVPES